MDHVGWKHSPSLRRADAHDIIMEFVNDQSKLIMESRLE